MPTIPGALMPFLPGQFLDPDGNPLAGGSVQFFVTGTDTPKDTFTSAQLTEANTNPVVLDGTGRATVFLEPGAYDALVYDVTNVLIYSVVGFEDIGQTFLATLGNSLAEGATQVESGYTVLTTEQLVTVDSTGGDDPCVINLPAATGYGGILTIKNLGTIELAVTPNGSDTIDTVAGAFTVPEAASPVFPSIILISDGVASWYVQASHGF